MAAAGTLTVVRIIWRLLQTLLLHLEPIIIQLSFGLIRQHISSIRYFGIIQPRRSKLQIVIAYKAAETEVPYCLVGEVIGLWTLGLLDRQQMLGTIMQLQEVVAVGHCLLMELALELQLMQEVLPLKHNE